MLGERSIGTGLVSTEGLDAGVTSGVCGWAGSGIEHLVRDGAMALHPAAPTLLSMLEENEDSVGALVKAPFSLTSETDSFRPWSSLSEFVRDNVVDKVWILGLPRLRLSAASRERWVLMNLRSSD